MAVVPWMRRTRSTTPGSPTRPSYRRFGAPSAPSSGKPTSARRRRRQVQLPCRRMLRRLRPAMTDWRLQTDLSEARTTTSHLEVGDLRGGFTPHPGPGSATLAASLPRSHHGNAVAPMHKARQPCPSRHLAGRDQKSQVMQIKSGEGYFKNIIKNRLKIKKILQVATLCN